MCNVLVIASAFWLLQVFYVVMYILWTFCYINYMNVTNIIDLCDSFIEVETFYTTITIFSFLETEQKTERN